MYYKYVGVTYRRDCFSLLFHPLIVCVKDTCNVYGLNIYTCNFFRLFLNSSSVK